MDYEPESELTSYAHETERLSALSAFLNQNLALPKGPDGKILPKLLADYASASEEALEAIRRIASRS